MSRGFLWKTFVKHKQNYIHINHAKLYCEKRMLTSSEVTLASPVYSQAEACTEVVLISIQGDSFVEEVGHADRYRNRSKGL